MDSQQHEPPTPPPLLVRLRRETAVAPRRATRGAVGYDLCAAHDAAVEARQSAVVSTGESFVLPPGCYGRVASRSGIAAQHGVEVGAGVIDPDYDGEVRVLLRNHSDRAFTVRTGDRIAQLILERCITPDVVTLPYAAAATATVAQARVDDQRRQGDAGGFGSTGGFQECRDAVPSKEL